MRGSQNFARTQKGRKRGKIFPDKSICLALEWRLILNLTIMWKVNNFILVLVLFQVNEV